MDLNGVPLEVKGSLVAGGRGDTIFPNPRLDAVRKSKRPSMGKMLRKAARGGWGGRGSGPWGKGDPSVRVPGLIGSAIHQRKMRVT